MAEQAPVKVEVVETKKPSLEELFDRHVERSGTAPTMNPGDLAQRPLRTDEEAKAPVEEKPQEETDAGTKEEAQEAAAEAGDYEFEWRGQKYAVPPELKEMHEGYLRTEDYTQKTQEVSELRRSAEAMLQQSRQQQELQQALAPQVARLNAINEQLQQYMKVDWNALYQNDATAAQQHSVNFSVLNNQKQALEREVQQTAQQHMTKIQETQRQMLEASDKAMAQKVKGWTRDTGKALNEFARKTYGFTENEVNTTLDPRALQMMHDAKSWRDLQSSKAQKVVPKSQTLKPAASQQQTGEQAKLAEVRRGIKSAKTDSAKARAIEQHPMWDRIARR